MAQNTIPIFVGTPRLSYANSGVNANTAFDGTGTVVTVFTAGSNGSKVESIRLWHLGTNVAGIVRIFVNNGLTNTTAANNALVYEAQMGAFTSTANGASSNGAQDQSRRQPLILQLPAGYKLNITIGTAVASGYAVTVQGGDY